MYDVFFSRYKLYKTYYHNLKSNGVDEMIGEILNLASSELKFMDACKELVYENNPKPYLRLTDRILERI